MLDGTLRPLSQCNHRSRIEISPNVVGCKHCRTVIATIAPRDSGNSAPQLDDWGDTGLPPDLDLSQVDSALTPATRFRPARQNASALAPPNSVTLSRSYPDDDGFAKTAVAIGVGVAVLAITVAMIIVFTVFAW